MEASPYKLAITFYNMAFQPGFVLRLIKYTLKAWFLDTVPASVL